MIYVNNLQQLIYFRLDLHLCGKCVKAKCKTKLGLISTFVKVTGEKLVGSFFRFSPFLNRVIQFSNPFTCFTIILIHNIRIALQAIIFKSTRHRKILRDKLLLLYVVFCSILDLERLCLLIRREWLVLFPLLMIDLDLL